MPRFSLRSQALLAQVHPDLRRLLDRAIRTFDFAVLPSTVRTVEEQAEFVRTGRSKTMHSKHLMQPDGYIHAVDIAPWPIDWDDRERFYLLQGYLRGLAEMMQVKIRQGCDWDGDGELADNFFDDLPHVELA